MTMTEDRGTDLTPFEGTDVAAVGIEITNAAGGLNDAMKVAPGEWHHGDVVTVVIRGRVRKIRHDELKETNALRRVHVLTADTCVVLENRAVDKALNEQAKKVKELKSAEAEAKRAEKGEAALAEGLGLPGEPSEEQYVQAHEQGFHADGLVDGCPECQAEVDAEARERGE